MIKLINVTGMFIIAMMFSCKPKVVTDCGDLPAMPMQAMYENSLEYTWSQKKVLESKLVSDMETMGTWEHSGGYGAGGAADRQKGIFGTISLSDEKQYKGKYSLLIESPTKGPKPPQGGRPWGRSGAFLKVDNEDWSNWNRISFWIYPDMPGHKIVSINTLFYNDGEDKVPDVYARNGFNYQMDLENHKWNKVYWEISHLGKDKVTGIEICYFIRGNEPGATETARYFIDEVYLEKVVPDHFEGWNVQPDEIAYNHAGYVKGFPKVAFTSENVGEKFYLKDQTSGQTVMEGVVTAQSSPIGSFRIIDFSDLNTEGAFVLEVGKMKTKPFIIGTFMKVYRSSVIKTINQYYCQRCGVPIPGIHDACHLDMLTTHEGKSIPIHGGWHDAGDLSQGVVNTAESAYAMMALAGKLKKTDPVLSDRLLDEAEWGISWVLRTRFGDGFRNVWTTKDMWTDGIIGNEDDYNTPARKDPHANFISSTAEAFAAMTFKDRNPFLAAHALKCAIEDYGFGIDIEPRRMNVQLAGAALNAALTLYEATADESYKTSAIEHANYLMSCQLQEDLDTNIPLKGFFYNTPEKNVIFHYSHNSHEQDFVVGLVRLSQLFPAEAAEWKKAISLYGDFYKGVCAHTAPYYMIPAGIYDATQPITRRTEMQNGGILVDITEQITNGVKLNERYYIKQFPVWADARGNSATTLSQAKGLAVIANFLKDKDLLNIAYHSLDWHLGMNPFAQSLMYGEGYRFASQYSISSGNLVGGLPVGIQTHFNRDEPYWPAENCYNWKEIWVHVSVRWLMLMNDF